MNSNEKYLDGEVVDKSPCSLMLILMLICCERKTLLVGRKVVQANMAIAK
jgi:hypothetical protein